MMKIKYSKLVKALLTISALFFMVGFSSLFFPKIEANVIEVHQAHFHQQGHSGVIHSNFSGRVSSTLIANYEYQINAMKYTGWGLAKNTNDKKISIKYFPLAPSISLSSSTPYFLFSFFLIFISFGIRVFIVWCKKIAYGHTS